MEINEKCFFHLSLAITIFFPKKYLLEGFHLKNLIKSSKHPPPLYDYTLSII